MKKIYVDQWFTSVMPNTDYVVYSDVDQIPEDCRAIGITFYNCLYKEYYKIIDVLQAKTKCLVVNVSEPTQPSLLNFVKRYPDVHFVGDAVFNVPIDNWKTVISWFISPENFYLNRPWAKNLLAKLRSNYDKTPDKLFDCLLGGTRPHRNKIANFLQNSSNRDKFIFSYFGATQQASTKAILPNNITLIDGHLNTIIDHEVVNLSWMIPVDIYNNSWYSIVAETTCYNIHNQFTEKVAKPIISKRPFIAFAGQHYLKNLRNLGFQTFSSVVDESYDGIEDFDNRMANAWQQVEWLCKQDPRSVCQQLESVLDHNRQHFLSTDWLCAVKKYF